MADDGLPLDTCVYNNAYGEVLGTDNQTSEQLSVQADKDRSSGD